MADLAGTNWTVREIDLIVADYFQMLALELEGKRFVKRERNAAMQALIGRSQGSIEFKHQNISAILVKLGYPWIWGYKPKANFQKALADGVERYLDFQPLIIAPRVAVTRGMHEAPALHFEVPPSITEAAPSDPAFIRRLVRKFDPAERDARNRALGKSGEEYVFHSERNRLIGVGRSDLAKKVRWVSAEDGDGAGYDIRSYEPSGHERLLEIKTTSGHQTTPFYLSENERLLSMARPDEFRLVRLYDFARTPKAFSLTPPLEICLLLRPTNYRASFGKVDAKLEQIKS